MNIFKKYGAAIERIYPSVEEINLQNDLCHVEGVESGEEIIPHKTGNRLALYNVYRCHDHCNRFYGVARFVKATKFDIPLDNK